MFGNFVSRPQPTCCVILGIWEGFKSASVHAFGPDGTVVLLDIGVLDLSRFDTVPLVAFTAPKTTNIGPKRTDQCSADAVQTAL